MAEPGSWTILPSDVDFVFLVLHHPPYTSSSDMKLFGGGHSARFSGAEAGQNAGSAAARDQRARIVVFSGHVHNYERHEHGGVTYFVLGGAGSSCISHRTRSRTILSRARKMNYHYLLVDVDRHHLKFTMNRLDLTSGEGRLDTT